MSKQDLSFILIFKQNFNILKHILQFDNNIFEIRESKKVNKQLKNPISFGFGSFNISFYL